MKAYIDYLRLATFDDSAYLETVGRLYHIFTKRRAGHWLQYQGFWSDIGFYGVGNQNGKRHYVMFVSGYAASDFAALMVDENFYCTRIDLQKTIENNGEYDARTEFDNLRAQFDGKRSLSIIQSDTGDTLYIGTRTSDLYTRIYEKAERQYLRLEFEIKGDTAKQVWHNLKIRKTTTTFLFDHFAKRLELPDWIRESFGINVDANHKLEKLLIDKESENTLRWLLSLTESIVKAANDPDIGPQVKTWIETISNRIDHYPTSRVE